MEGKERPKKGRPLQTGRGFNKQSKLTYEVYFQGAIKTNRFLHPPARILKVYVKVLPEFSYVCHSDGLNSTLLPQDYALENGSHCGNNVQSVNSKAREQAVELLIP